jgi:hypothetical protein
MEVRFPHQILYEVPADVPVADAIDALLGAERVLLDIGPLLERLVPDLQIQVRVYVREITGGSLREVLIAALFITYQKDLEKEVPDFVNKLFGVDLTEHSTMATVLFVLLLYYGAEFVFKLVNKTVEHSHLRDALDGMVHAVAGQFHLSEEAIRRVLEDRYGSDSRGGSSRVKLLSRAALRVFAPSKRQNNAAMAVGYMRIEPLLIAEVPSDARILELEDPSTTEPVENVRIELHAQDVDRAKIGWAAIIPEISETRLRMQIYPPLKPEDIYTKATLMGDIILVSRRNEAGQMEPYMFHLVRLHES